MGSPGTIIAETLTMSSSGFDGIWTNPERRKNERPKMEKKPLHGAARQYTAWNESVFLCLFRPSRPEYARARIIEAPAKAGYSNLILWEALARLME